MKRGIQGCKDKAKKLQREMEENDKNLQKGMEEIMTSHHLHLHSHLHVHPHILLLIPFHKHLQFSKGTW